MCFDCFDYPCILIILIILITTTPAIHLLDGKIVRKEQISDGARAQLFTSKGIGHLLGRGYGTGVTGEGSEQAPVDLEAATRKQEEEEAAKQHKESTRPMMIEECKMTEIRQPRHYARELGNANKTPALMAKAMRMNKEDGERRSMSTDEWFEHN